MSAPKNLSASVKARLLALARSRDETFNALLTRYGIERLLYRLGRSRHADRFLLKGAMLFVLWDVSDSLSALRGIRRGGGKANAMGGLPAAQRPGKGPAAIC